MGFNGGSGTLVSQELHANILQTEWQVNRLSSYLSSYGVFALPDSQTETCTYSHEMYKGYTGADSNGDSFDDSDIAAKLGTVAICIRIGTGIGSVYTLLHINIGSIFILIDVEIGVFQCKHTIKDISFITMLCVFVQTLTCLLNNTNFMIIICL